MSPNMLTSTLFVLHLTCLAAGNLGDGNLSILPVTVHQERLFTSADVGATVTLECFYRGTESAWLFWYRQAFDQEPQIISTFHSFDTKVSFHDAFKNDQRFDIKMGDGVYHLKISGVNVSDSGTYFCAASSMNFLKFATGTTVVVKGAGSTVVASIDQSAQSVSGSFQRGGSVTLSCLVHAGGCDDEPSVYWFKKSHPRVLYGSKRDQTKPGTRSCIHRTSLKSLNESHPGTYYCAVVACGHILFGNGIQLDFDRDDKTNVLVYSLIAALTLSTSMVVLLSGLAYKLNQRNRSESAGLRCSAPLTTITEDDPRDTEDLHYAALSVRQANRSGTQKTTSSDCIYSAVKK